MYIISTILIIARYGVPYCHYVIIYLYMLVCCGIMYLLYCIWVYMLYIYLYNYL